MKLKKTSKDPDIPTSSMADIAFLLIVFFMITTVFSANRGIAHMLPPENTDGSPDPAILINVFPTGDIKMDGNILGQHELSGAYHYVRNKLQINPNKAVILLTDRKASYGHMVSVMDMLKKVENELGSGFVMNLTLPTETERKRYVNAGMM